VVRRPPECAIDTYAIPPLPQCNERKPERGVGSLSKTPQPVPEGWTVALTSPELELGPGEETTVQAAITPPASFSGTLPFNITARNTSRPIGGVTLYVKVP
jgi:hypothetical protein